MTRKSVGLNALGQWGESRRFRARARVGVEGAGEGGRAGACAHARAGSARCWRARGAWVAGRVGGPTWGRGAGGGMRIQRLATSVSVPEPIPRSACGEGAL